MSETLTQCAWSVYIGHCKSQAVANGYCEEHYGKQCHDSNCVNQATHDCSFEGQFVCGYPVCGEYNRFCETHRGGK